MNVNDGKGLFDKFGMVDEMLKKMDILADSHGALRCGLIWDIYGMLKALKDGLAKEDAATKDKIEMMKSMLSKGGE